VSASVPTPPNVNILYEGVVKNPVVVYRSEIMKENLKPVWKEFKLDIDLVGGLENSIIINVFDWVNKISW
jgi:Ca2+-dependent lipid-binding protein